MLIVVNPGEDDIFCKITALLNTVIKTQQDTNLQIEKNQKEVIMLFSEYRSAVDDSLTQILTLVASESTDIQAAIAAAGSAGDSAAIDAAFTALNEKRATIAEAIHGLITSAPVPTPPIVVPPVSTEPLPIVVPEPPVSTPEPSPNPVVPVDSTPSPSGVGLPNGVDLTGTLPTDPSPTPATP